MFFNKKILFSFVFLISLIFVDKTEAKRMEPQKVEPLVYSNFVFLVDHKQIVDENQKIYFIAYVIKKDKNNVEIWKKEVYRILIKEDLEEDIQTVFIKKIYIENDKLVVINEKDEKFIVDTNDESIQNTNKKEVVINNIKQINNLKNNDKLGDKSSLKKFDFKIVGILIFILIVFAFIFFKFKFSKK